MHTITRESEDDRKSITQDDLLDMALRFHPDYIVVGEMRSSEADSAQEAARTGHTVITTIHSNSCESTWRRMVTLCKRKYPNVDDKVILDLIQNLIVLIAHHQVQLTGAAFDGEDTLIVGNSGKQHAARFGNGFG